MALTIGARAGSGAADSREAASRPEPSVRVEIGDQASAATMCNGCRYDDLTMSGFSPNTRFDIDWLSSRFDGDWCAPFYQIVETDSTGAASISRPDTCMHGYFGDVLWAVAGGVESPKVIWNE